MNYEFAPQSYTEFFSFVIQSEAKDLGNTHFMYMRFFTTLRSVLNDRNGITLWMTSKYSVVNFHETKIQHRKTAMSGIVLAPYIRRHLSVF